MIITAERHHDISCGHRVVGHENKCAYLHGHNYRFHFTVVGKAEDGPVDSIGRVLDFSVINSTLCQWLEQHWDHKFLAWVEDRMLREMLQLTAGLGEYALLKDSIVWCSFNPTAENMARHLLVTVGPQLLMAYNVKLIKVQVDETRKCSATASL